ncbi:Sideroflexin-3 [Goodea atripinnis]|uniref:Sideroflexin-3 n=1 Tax=Goodea atripinnis TaxID=208336 RepID=A0ABV0PQK0_9TELE
MLEGYIALASHDSPICHECDIVATLNPNPRNVLLSSETLEEARVIVENYRAGTVKPGLTEDELWRAKYIYDSAFHPDTGEKMFVIGRMSAQVPMNMSITGCMLTFYRYSRGSDTATADFKSP